MLIIIDAYQYKHFFIKTILLSESLIADKLSVHPDFHFLFMSG
jgi:hypothetical protein